MDAIETKTIGKYKIEVFYDESPYDPREDDNLGTMVCFHGRYMLGDKHDYRSEDYSGWEEMKKAIIKNEDVGVILPLYLYDHSGITMNTTGFSCPWDSGQVGWVFISKEKMRKEYSYQRVSKKLKERVRQYLVAEIEHYDKYIRGEVYGYHIHHEDGTFLDGCWGYYEMDFLMEEAEATVLHKMKSDKHGQLEIQYP